MKLRASVWTVDPRDGEVRYQVRELDVADANEFTTTIQDEELRARGVDAEVSVGPIGPPWGKL